MRKLSQTFHSTLLTGANAILEKLENVAICQCRRSTYALRFASESITDDRESRVCYIRVHNNTHTHAYECVFGCHTMVPQFE